MVIRFSACSAIGGLVVAGVVVAVHQASPQTSPLTLAIVAGFAAAVTLPICYQVLRTLDRRLQGGGGSTAVIMDAAVTLVGVDDEEEVVSTLRALLIDKLGLTRGYLLVPDSWEDPDSALRCASLAGEEQHVAPLPDRCAPGEFSPIQRALEQGEYTNARDPVARGARQQPETSRGGDRRGEAGFWAHYGIEAVLPAFAVTPARPMVGLLALGPRGDGRPLDPDFVREICPLLAAALQNVRRLSRLREADADLDRRIIERTGMSQDSIVELKTAHHRLIEAESQAVVGRLVAGVVHEMNTPLGTMRSSVDTLERAAQRCLPLLQQLEATSGTPEARRALKAVEVQRSAIEVLGSSSARITEVVAKLQRFVGLDAAEVSQVQICESILDAAALVSAGRDEIKICTDLPEPSLLVEASPTKLNRMFLSLLENACKSINGSGEIHVRASLEDGFARVEIKDTGEKIPASRLDRLFKLGFTAMTNGRIGLRMGLPASKRTVDEIGGDLTIRSGDDGSTVVVKLPLSPALERPAAERKA
jgi:two-component system, NtrC family, sensor kinase